MKCLCSQNRSKYRITLSLKEKGIKKGSIVGISLADHEETLCSVLGVIQAGAAYTIVSAVDVTALLAGDVLTDIEAVITGDTLSYTVGETPIAFFEYSEIAAKSGEEVAAGKFEPVGADDIVKYTINKGGTSRSD